MYLDANIVTNEKELDMRNALRKEEHCSWVRISIPNISPISFEIYTNCSVSNNYCQIYILKTPVLTNFIYENKLLTFALNAIKFLLFPLNLSQFKYFKSFFNTV
jgi:hypothetical protein